MNIVILSRNAALYSTDSLIRAAQHRGHHVRVIDHLMCDLVIEQNKLQIYYYSEPVDDVDAIIPRIGSSSTTYGAAIIRQFTANNVYSTVRSDALLKARDKLSCLQYLAQKNIDVPKTVIINNQLMIDDMLNHIEGEQKIVKLTSGTHGLGVILTESNQNAESIIEAFSKVRQKSLIQEFIKESDGSDIRLIVVGDKVVATMCRQAAEGEFRSNLHRGGSSYAVTPTEEERKIAIKASQLLGLDVAGVDMLRSARGPLILEVNASPGLEGIEGTTGIDVAGKIMELVERNANANWRKV
jgi:ribosomal protein S6--L-glutamate ligase